MDKEIAQAFACLMEEYLHVSPKIGSLIENKIRQHEYEEVVEYIVVRKKEIDNGFGDYSDDED